MTVEHTCQNCGLVFVEVDVEPKTGPAAWSYGVCPRCGCLPEEATPMVPPEQPEADPFVPGGEQ